MTKRAAARDSSGGDAFSRSRTPTALALVPKKAVARSGTKVHSLAVLRAGVCGKPALPALLGRGVKFAGISGFWVGHSSGRFAVELMSDRFLPPHVPVWRFPEIN